MKNMFRRLFPFAPPAEFAPATIDDGHAVIRLPVTLGTAERQVFKAQVLDALSRGATSFVIDCADTLTMSSGGLGALCLMSKKAKLQGYAFAVSNLSPDLRTLFEVTGVERLVDVLPPEAA